VPGLDRGQQRSGVEGLGSHVHPSGASEQVRGLEVGIVGYTSTALAAFRLSHSDDVPLGGELGARSVQLGVKNCGESRLPQRSGVCQRESVLGSEVIGDDQEVVAGLLVAACYLFGTAGMGVQVASPEATRSVEWQVVPLARAPP